MKDETLKDNIKSVVRSVLPPVLLDSLRMLLRYFRIKKGELEYIPEGWDYLKRVRGWNVRSVAESFVSLWRKTFDSVKGKGPLADDLVGHNTLVTFAYVLMLVSRGKSKLRILDWGGGIGCYYLLSKELIPDVEIDYTCKDVPILCDYGRRIFPEVKFYDNDDYLKHTYDFSLLSGALQYAVDWRTTLINIRNVTKEYVFVTRLPVVQRANSFLILQRAYDTEFLGWVFNRNEFLQYAQDISLNLVREFLISEKVRVPRAPEPFDNRGFLFCVSGNFPRPNTEV